MTLTSTHHPTVPWFRLGLGAVAITLAVIALIAGYRIVTDDDAGATNAPAALSPAVVGPRLDIGPDWPVRSAAAKATVDPRVLGPNLDIGPDRTNTAARATVDPRVMGPNLDIGPDRTHGSGREGGG